MRKLAVVVVAVFVAALLTGCIPVPPGGPASGGTSTAGVSGGQVVYQAASGQANKISVYGGYIYDANSGQPKSGPYTYIQDRSGNAIAAGASCRQGWIDDDNNTLDRTKVLCPYDSGVTLYLGDGSDTGKLGAGQKCTAKGLNYCNPKYGETWRGGSGNDTITASAGNLYGESDNDTLNGGANHENLYGGDGNDTITGGGGADTIDCGYGSQDWIYYLNSPAPVKVTLDGTSSGGDAQGDTNTNCENINGSGAGDTLTGNEGANQLQGQGGDDKLVGKGGNDALHSFVGNDTLDGGSGADVFWCNDGDDTVSYANSPGSVNVVMGGTSTGSDAQGDQVTTECENVIGSKSGDVITGSSSPNQLLGYDGNDTLNGKGGGDVLYGGTGDDRLNGGAEGDLLFCEDGGGDIATYADSTVAVNAYIGGVSNGGEAQGDQVDVSCEGLEGSLQGDNLFGNDAPNLLRGNGGSDALWGYGGDDTLQGGAGDDAMNGGPGADTLTCGGNHDWASYWNSPGKVSVTISDSVKSSWNDAQGDLVGTTCEQVDGSPYNDTIIGSEQNDVLKGFAGNDTILGMGGNDTIEGGADADTIISKGDSDSGKRDIVDCGSESDTVDLDKDTLIDCERTVGNQNPPVILIHGFYPYGEVISGGHDCFSHWDVTKRELRARGYLGPIRTMGYYNKNGVKDVNCDLVTTEGADNNTPIETIAQRVANRIYDEYGNQPVNLVGHSMGGMIARRIMLERLRGNINYKGINIANLVTVQSPLQGSTYTIDHPILGSICRSTQCEQLLPTSAFVQWFADNDSLGTGTTDVTEIGSATDEAVTLAQSMNAFTAQHKMMYGSPPAYPHKGSYLDPSRTYDLSVGFSDVSGGAQFWTGGAPHGIEWLYLAVTRTDW
jgi:Ca2+-binding RTX toxin-like protein